MSTGCTKCRGSRSNGRFVPGVFGVAGQAYRATGGLSGPLWPLLEESRAKFWFDASGLTTRRKIENPPGTPLFTSGAPR